MAYLYTTLIHQPLLNLLVFFYNTIAFQDLGLAIIFLTILVRLILFPLFQKSMRTQTIMQELQPHVKRIQAEHKKDLKKQSESMMALYREHKVNPFSGFLLLIVQLPLLIALYQVFGSNFDPKVFTELYSFVHVPANFHQSFLGLINLGNRNMLIVASAAIAQYFQGKVSFRGVQKGAEMNPAQGAAKTMIFVGPVITFTFLLYLPAAVGLYWLVTSLFTIGQQLIINKTLKDGKMGKIHSNNA